MILDIIELVRIEMGYQERFKQGIYHSTVLLIASYILCSIKAVRVSLILYAVFSFVSVGFDETFPIFADSSRRYGKIKSFLFTWKPLYVAV